MTDWKQVPLSEEERIECLTAEVNKLYEGFTPMQIRRCVITMCESQFLDLTMKEVMDRYSSQEIVRVWSTEREAMDVRDVRWDNEHPEVVAFNSSSRDEEPVPEEYGDPNISIKELLDGTV